MIVLLIVLITGVFAAFRSTIRSLVKGVWETAKYLISLVTKFPEELGVTDYFKILILYLGIAVICTTLGIVLIKRTNIIFSVLAVL